MKFNRVSLDCATFPRVALGILISVLLFPLAAQAASIKNRDDKDRTVTIIEGSTPETVVLKPNQTIDGVCMTGCLVRIDGNRTDPFELEGPEVTSIEDGLLYDDEAGAPAVSGSGSAAKPSQPGSRP